MIITGIDPGACGAIVSILPDHSLEWVRFRDTDQFNKSCYQVKEFLERISLLATDGQVYLEKVHSMPGQGVSSVFTFGRMAGIIEGMMKQEGLQYNLVQPQEWQRFLKLENIVGKTTFKNAAAKKLARKKAYLEVAKKLFPKYAKDITLDIADAVLIAEYGYRKAVENEYDV